MGVGVMDWGDGLKTERPGVVPGLRGWSYGYELCGAGRCSGGIGLTDWKRLGLLLTKVRVERGRIVDERTDRLPEQIVGKPGHGHPAAPALAVKRADHVV